MDEPFNLPFCWNKMPGSVDSYMLTEKLIKVIATVVEIKEFTFDVIPLHIEDDVPAIPMDLPPTYFKLGNLSTINHVEKTIAIDISDNMPISNCGDGVGVNVKAACLLDVLYGINTPSSRCAAHASDGTLKRLARSETMSVEQLKSCYDSLKVVKHFSKSCGVGQECPIFLMHVISLI